MKHLTKRNRASNVAKPRSKFEKEVLPTDNPMFGFSKVSEWSTVFRHRQVITKTSQCPWKVKDKFSLPMISRAHDTLLESSSRRKGAADKVYAPHYFLLSIPRRCFYGALTAPCHREMGWKRVGILCQLLFTECKTAFFCPAFRMPCHTTCTTSWND